MGDNCMETISLLKKSFSGIMFYESTQLWFGVYPYRLKLNAYVRQNNVWYWLGYHFFSAEPNEKKFKVYSGKRMTIYFSDLTSLEAMIKHFEYYVIDVCILSDTQITLLKQNSKLKLRNQLYFKQYKHKIRLDRSSRIGADILNELKTWIRETFDLPSPPKEWRGTSIRNGRVWFRHEQCEPTIFLCNDDDITLVKLAWGEYFSIIETVQLLSRGND